MMKQQPVSLTSLAPGDRARVVDIEGEGAFRRRLLDMGFVTGAHVRVIKHAPLRSPIEYCIGGTHVTLRRSEAKRIIVEVVAAPPWCSVREAGPGRHRFRRRHKRGPRWAHGKPSR
jgi:Fe2+ transport system protein FeoA